ncbi:DNA translocase FtsK 4TM domain-containing protein [Flavobacterium ponti]|uniref:DNA translocase FtsK 4TM domain-containing protein n=1 Tax=Flavobacterium ponti TaxID=665133 RepID=A0ABV9P785_9FLAO
MAKKQTPKPKKEKSATKNYRQHRFVIGCLLVLIAIALLISFISYYVTGNHDQSQLGSLIDRTNKTQNWLGKFGAYLADFFIYRGFGVASIIFVKSILMIGIYFILDISIFKLRKSLFWDFYLIITFSLLFGFFWDQFPNLSGIIGYEVNQYVQHYIGKIGTLLLLILVTIAFLVFKMKMSPDKIKDKVEKIKNKIPTPVFEQEDKTITKESENNIIENIETNTPKDFVITEDEEAISKIELKPNSTFEIDKGSLKPTIGHPSELSLDPKVKETPKEEEKVEQNFSIEDKAKKVIETSDENFVIETAEEEETVEGNLAAKIVENFGEFDPTLELSNYKMPSVELLKEYSSGGITINQDELEQNKNKILETLKNYGIGISQIKATVGPTVTLYEIVPDAGVRISKIKNLEDDIALSLAALGIRIIAPIPGKGTIGIEVPNANPTLVSMKSVISSTKFQQSEMELPVALGKTISNETFVFDLAKMPHLLMAGATGQGKSVGLNAVLTSLLYKKHPAEVKFVLVDPKKVELTLFNKIERHYLAKLPDTEDAIITDNAKVINTLNSLCIEMDNRYSLLKDAMVRNIKEYNEKFKIRKLNPENGHRFLPYIVLVVDEFADLIMTAGKEVETPIARLAQLARAIGIHLIIATQRPSVNVITGMIKANFPARIAFRVTSKIDSRTILDSGGADQLIGRGDLLFTQGNEIVRVQCAFVDTPEVEKITDYIGSQKAYPEAYQLPEYVGEESGTKLDMDISERDTLFRDAAEVIVTAQQGSASLIQRKLKLGYNRAGRIIDQLEAAGIVGPFEGSKARSVLIPDLVALEQFLNNEQNNS